METYFEGIKEVVIQEIEKAEFIVYVAVAWITDYDIITALIKSLKAGVQVEIVVNGDRQFSKVKQKFNEFLIHGGKIFLYENTNKSIMHNKFCIIDLNTVITGSYNWSFSASNYHKENIVIEKGNLLFAQGFAREFSKLKRSSVVFDSKYIPYDSAFYADASIHTIFSEEGFEPYCLVEITEQKKNDRLGMLTLFCSPHLIPDTIFGVWTERAKWLRPDDDGKWIETDELAFVDGRPLYGFDCLDSRLSSYKHE